MALLVAVNGRPASVFSEFVLEIQPVCRQIPRGPCHHQPTAVLHPELTDRTARPIARAGHLQPSRGIRKCFLHTRPTSCQKKQGAVIEAQLIPTGIEST